MGLMAFLPVLTAYVGERYGITDEIELTFWGGAIYGMAPFSAAIIGPVWGALGDRFGKKPMAIRANLAIALTTLLMPFAPTPFVLLLLRIVQGAFAGYVAPAMALVIQDAPPQHQGRTIAGLQVAMAFGTALGPMLGAEVSLLFGRQALFWVTSALSGLSGLLLWRFAQEVRTPQVGERQPFGSEFRSALTGLLRNRVFLALLLLVLLLRLGQNMLEPFLVLFVRQLGAPEWMRALTETGEAALEYTINVAFTVLAVAQWVFTPLWGRYADRFGPLRCLAVLAVVLGGVLAVTSQVRGIDGFLGLRCAAACFMAGSMTLAYAAASKRVVPERRTLAFSLVQSCMQFGFALGPLLGAQLGKIGATAEHANLRLLFAVAGGLCVLAGIGMFVLRLWPAGRDEHGAQRIGAARR